VSRLVYTLYDIGFVIDPTWKTERNRLRCFDGLFKSSLAADWVIAISEHSRANYLDVFPHYPRDRVRVVDPCRLTETTQTGTRPEKAGHLGEAEFWLSVGTIEPRKNQRLLVQDYARYLEAGGRPMPLVLAGGMGWMMTDFRQYVAELGIADKVILLGYVSDEEMIWLYRNCYAHLCPSVFEGFGLPVLEGMQFGAPILRSNASSLPEVAGDAAVLLSPASTEDWAQSVLTIAASRETRENLSAAGGQQARKFDRDRSAASVLDIYREAASLPKRIFSN
jgi:glycosyltransferase involved in cell wall biosynthesis